MTRVLLFGSDHLAYRIVEQLRDDGCAVRVVAVEGSWLAQARLPQGVTVSHLHASEPPTIEPSAHGSIDVVFAVSDRDELNLGMALAALEANEHVRVVLRQFNLRLGRLLETELPHCEVLSLSAIAAPTFALAALTPGVLYACTVGDGKLVLRRVRASERNAADTIVAIGSGGHVDLLPDPAAPIPEDAMLLVATDEHRVPLRERSNQVRRPPSGKPPRSGNRILLGTLAYLAMVISVGTAYFEWYLGVSTVDALYFVVTTVMTVGYGDYSLRDADALSKVIGMVLMISGVMATAVIFAMVTNTLLSRQRSLDQGHARVRFEDHVVVFGLGIVG